MDAVARSARGGIPDRPVRFDQPFFRRIDRNSRLANRSLAEGDAELDREPRVARTRVATVARTRRHEPPDRAALRIDCIERRVAERLSTARVPHARRSGGWPGWWRRCR